jgi:hypothetical protein
VSVEVSEFINVHQKLNELGAEYPADGIALLPLNISTAESIGELKQASEAATVRKLLRQADIPVKDILSKEKRPPYVKNKSNDWVSPIIFVSATVWNNNPELVSVALNIVSSYIYDAFKGVNGTRTAKLSVVVEDPNGKSTRIDYEGPPEAVKDLAKVVREAKK